jgi:hypothetical protein
MKLYVLKKVSIKDWTHHKWCSKLNREKKSITRFLQNWVKKYLNIFLDCCQLKGMMNFTNKSILFSVLCMKSKMDLRYHLGKKMKSIALIIKGWIKFSIEVHLKIHKTTLLSLKEEMWRKFNCRCDQKKNPIVRLKAVNSNKVLQERDSKTLLKVILVNKKY